MTMHSYDVGNQSSRLVIYAKIALFTFITVLLADSFKSGNFDLTSFMKTYGGSITLVTITFFSLHKLYDQFLWSCSLNLLNKTPNLSGTWIGIGINSHFKPERLELMKIKQTWSNIGIDIEVYEKSEPESEGISGMAPKKWSNTNTKKIGTEYSTSTRITECDFQKCFCEFIYKANGQTEFNGAMFLTFDQKIGVKKLSTLALACTKLLEFIKSKLVSEYINKSFNDRNYKEETYRLSGKYANTREGRFLNNSIEEDYNGLSGRIIFYRISSRIIAKNEVFDLNKIDTILSEIEEEINYKSKKFSKG